MPDPKDGQEGGEGGSGDGKPPAPPAKSADQRLAELEETNKRMLAEFQSTREELKRVNSLNGALMQRLQRGGNGAPPDPADNGMTARNTIKLKRDFSQMDPASDPQGYAKAVIEETAEQVAESMQRMNSSQRTNDNLRRMFYEKNKDLVGWERVVAGFSEDVGAEMPHLTFDQAAEEVARRTRDFVKSKGVKAPDEPPGVIPPGGQNGGDDIHIKPPKGAGPEPYDEGKDGQESTSDYLKERNAERTKLGGTRS